MPRVVQGIVAVLGRILLSTIFLMSAVGNDIPNFSAVTALMAKVGIPAPQFMLAGCSLPFAPRKGAGFRGAKGD